MACTFCRRDAVGVRCDDCGALYCSSECKQYDVAHRFACYSAKGDKLDIIDIAKVFSAGFLKPGYLVRKIDKDGWKIQFMDSSVTKWTTFTPRKLVKKAVTNRHLRHGFYHKAACANYSDQTMVDLGSLLCLLQKEHTLTLHDKPVTALYFCSVNMERSPFYFVNPLVGGHPLVKPLDIQRHLLLGVNTAEQTWALDVTLPQFDVYSFADNGAPLFLCPMGVFKDSLVSTEMVNKDSLLKIRKLVDASAAPVKKLRQQRIAHTLQHMSTYCK